MKSLLTKDDVKLAINVILLGEKKKLPNEAQYKVMIKEIYNRVCDHHFVKKVVNDYLDEITQDYLEQNNWVDKEAM